MFISESKTQGMDACTSSLPCILMLLNALVRGAMMIIKLVNVLITTSVVLATMVPTT